MNRPTLQQATQSTVPNAVLSTHVHARDAGPHHPVAAGEDLLEVLQVDVHATDLDVAHTVKPAAPESLLRRVSIPAAPPVCSPSRPNPLDAKPGAPQGRLAATLQCTAHILQAAFSQTGTDWCFPATHGILCARAPVAWADTKSQPMQRGHHCRTLPSASAESVGNAKPSTWVQGCVATVRSQAAAEWLGAAVDLSDCRITGLISTTTHSR